MNLKAVLDESNKSQRASSSGNREYLCDVTQQIQSAAAEIKSRSGPNMAPEIDLAVTVTSSCKNASPPLMLVTLNELTSSSCQLQHLISKCLPAPPSVIQVFHLCPHSDPQPFPVREKKKNPDALWTLNSNGLSCVRHRPASKKKINV